MFKTSRYAAGLLLLAPLAACSDSGDDGTTPPPTPTIAIAVSPASVNITAGSTGQTGITLTRGGGYTGAVALSLEGAPAGVTGAFNPATIATGATTSTLTIDLAGSTAAGTYTLTVRGTGSGVSAATATLSLTVAPAPSFDLSLTPASLNITQGASGSSTVNVTRGGGFAGGVTMALEGAPAGITGTFTPNPATANSSALAIAVANTVAAGNYPLTVRGTATGLPAKTAQLTVTVLAAPAGSFTLSLTPATLNITQGQAANSTVNIARTGGFAANVTLSLEGAPAGVTSTFTPNPAGGAASTLAVTVGAGTAPGNYDLTVRGTTPNPSPDGGLTMAAMAEMAPDQTVSLTLTVAVAGNYTLSATAATAAQGGTGNSTVTLTRTGGNTSSVTLALEGAPAGVTGALAPNPTAGGTSTLTLTVGAAVAVGNYNLTVRGTAAGLADQTTTFQVSVTATGFTLLVVPDDITVAAGANGNATININRTGGFAGSVALTHTTTAPAGVTVSFNPAATTGNTSTMTVTVGGGVAPGLYNVTIKGNATGQPERTTFLQLRVVAGGGGGSVQWTFCAQSDIPVWAAYQNGTGGAWTPAVAVGNTYSFNITDTRGGIAWVEVNGAEAELAIIYGSVQELQNNTPFCRGNGTTKTVNATMANLQPTQSSMVTLGGAVKSVNVATQANFAIEAVPDGTIDLFATNYSQTFFPVSQTLNGIIIRRNLEPVAGSTLVPTLDWNGAEKITPVIKNLTVTNGVGSLQAAVTYLTANGTGALLGFISGAAPYTFYGMPDASRVAGDLHILTVSTAPQNPYAYQAVSRIFAAAEDQTVTLGSNPPGAGFTTAATVPYLRPRITFTNLAEYNRSILMYWANAGGTQNSATVQIWEGYGQPLAVDYTLPDFSAVAGWSNAWGLQPGVGNTGAGYNVTGWTAGGGAGLPPSAAGTTSYTAGLYVDNISP